MAKSAAKATAALNILDDGTATVTISFNDADGLPITTLTTYPTAVALPTVTSSDQTPGPSAFTITPAATPTVNAAGGFAVASIACVVPVVQPAAQNVDFTVTIASGLTGQTAPIAADAGTLSIVADASQPSGFAPVISEP
jgi:hypothetical protein